MGSDFTRPYQSRVKDRTAFIKHNFRFGAEKFVFIIMARRIGTYHATTANIISFYVALFVSPRGGSREACWHG